MNSSWLCRILTVVSLTLAVNAAPCAVLAQEIAATRKIGVGIGSGTIGDLGLTAKYYVASTMAVQAFVGRYKVRELAISVDAVVEPVEITKILGGRLWAGGGAGVVTWGSAGSRHIGLSAVVQSGYHFSRAPVELVLDWRPYYDLDGDLELGALSGAVRWYF
ncbi:MAG: hypothetical protein EXR77_16910 [Myxococcales bacterium]|nr:hypothetical protein [Myxococcales bacterium]